MAAEFDHLFICVSTRANEAGALMAFGLNEGPPNKHPGQGTACRRFPFRNAYIELLWVDNPTEAQSATAQPIHLWERWARRESGGCPFGLGFRPATQADKDAPFPAWDYSPPYLPAGWSFQVATNAAVLSEPMLFYLPFGRRPDTRPGGKLNDLEHAAGLNEITRVEIVSPTSERVSPALLAVLNSKLIAMQHGAAHLVELGFDGEARGGMEDFRPGLPLIFRW
jgi:hypothetical protein